MTDDPRVEALLEKLLESGGTPDEVCRDCPELLPQVRAGWQQLRVLQAEVGALFPESSSANDTLTGGMKARSWPNPELPHIPGHEVKEVIGHGGMGIVYKARHLRLNRVVAVKMLLSGVYARPAELERLLREAEDVAGLHHRNIVQVYEVGDVDGRPYFTMEFMEGGSLAAKMTGTPWAAREAAALVADIAEAIDVAHYKRIIHRDLKPGNILVTADGTPKLTDFGLARHMQNGGGLTLSGAAVGTPSYMAPEQARGEKNTIGPAADIYALGAILYELLAGRPPFRGESGAATLQQVMTDDPVRPARLNPRVPRDLETICLKCLNKEPSRRYTNAQALADDLRRFLRGEPIVARPLGPLGRLARRARRHPVSVTLVAVGLMLVLGASAGLLWIDHQRVVNAKAVEEDLRDMVRFGDALDLDKARTALGTAEARFGEAAPADIRQRIKQAAADLELAVRLEQIRLKRSTYVECSNNVGGRKNHPAQLRFNDARAARDYAKAFREAGLCEPLSEPQSAAARLKAVSMRAPIVAALDDWALCCTEKRQWEWLLSVGRLVDPDTWRDRVCGPTAWDDPVLLAKLAQTAPVDQRARLSLLLALAGRLQLVAGNATALLRRVQEKHPDDFWTNFTLANMLYGEGVQGKGDPTRAIVYYREAIKLRPKMLAVCNNLGLVLFAKFWLDDNPSEWGTGAINVFRQASWTDPDFAAPFNNLGVVFEIKGDWNEAAVHYQNALRIDPQMAPAHANLAGIQAGAGQFYKAIDHYRQAIRLDPAFAEAHLGLGLALEAKGLLDETNECFPEGVKALDLFRGWALNEAVHHYHQAYEYDPKWVFVPNMLQISAQDESRLNEAIGHFRQAIQADSQLARAYGALGQALLTKWDFREAEASIKRCLDLLPGRANKFRSNLELQLQRCKQLIALEERLPAIVQGNGKLASTECLDVAELCFVKRHYAAAARIYAEGFAAMPELADDLRIANRFNAACAAALAGCGKGDDVGPLQELELKALREQARELLQLDLTAWTKKVADGTPADPIQAQRMLAGWRQNAHLAGLRDADALNKLSPAERQQWQVLWQKVAEVEKYSQSAPPSGKSLARLREQMEGKWRHVVAGTPLEIELLRSGKINDESSRATWTLQGRSLTLTWPDDRAPDRAWVDRCRVSEDGNSYAGINQQGADIRGMKIR
jgi:serine/threonine-protein kinase